LTREGIEAQDMPFVIASPDPMVGEVIAIDTFDEGSGMAVRLWKVGKGPAMVSKLSLRTGDGDVLVPLASQIPVATGQAHDLKAPLSLSANKLPDRWSGELLILYAHASGSPYVTVSKVEVDSGAVTCRNYERSPAGHVEGAWKRTEARAPHFAGER
jgi:hypothetical protein